MASRMIKKSEAEKTEIREHLRSFLTPGSTVMGVVTSVAKSGMSRHITFIACQEGKPVNIGWSIAALCGYRIDDNHELIVRGCGMNMIFAVVYDLGHELYPAGFTDDGCQKDGGYALNYA